MTALVTVETLLLVLMAMLVAGLLRSHAEILRRLEAIDHKDEESTITLPEARDASTPAFDVAGTTLEGDAVKVAVTGGAPQTLLAFLSSGCLSCQPFWEGLARGAESPVSGVDRVVVVTKDSAYESPSRLSELAPADAAVVMSSAAWDAYGVKGSPYFIHADGRGRVLGEGTASTWAQVASLVRDARADREAAARRGDSSLERLRRADRELREAGIGPGHPSLYGRSPDPDGDGGEP